MGTGSQATTSRKGCGYLSASLNDAYNQARLKAVSASHSRDWLYVLPITARSLRLDTEAIRIAVGLVGPVRAV